MRIFIFVDADQRYWREVRSLRFAIKVVRRGYADGLCIAYRDENLACAYEVQPGRSIASYHNDEVIDF